jgi:nitrogen fixation-related uncharacterized protein
MSFFDRHELLILSVVGALALFVVGMDVFFWRAV